MAKSHLKRYATPKTWDIKKKGITFVTRPNPGAHPMELSLPLNVFMKTVLKLANTTREVRNILNSNEVLVDGRRVKELKFPVGIMDVISMPSLKKNYRVVFSRTGSISATEIDEKEAKLKVVRVIGKTLLRGGKMQLNLSDGRNINVEKGAYKAGDSIVIEVPSQKITGHFKLEKGAAVLLYAGKHIAREGVVEKAEAGKIIFKTKEGEMITTSREYAFVVGKETPCLKIM